MTSPFAKQKREQVKPFAFDLKGESVRYAHQQTPGAPPAASSEHLVEMDFRVKQLEARMEVLNKIVPFLEQIPAYDYFYDYLVNEMKPVMARVTDQRLPQINIMGEFQRLGQDLQNKYDSLSSQIQEEAGFARSLEGNIQEVEGLIQHRGSEILELKKTMERKVNSSDFRRVEQEAERALKKFDLYVEKETYKEQHDWLKSEINLKCKKEQFNELQDAFQNFQNKMTHALRPLASKEFVQDKVLDLKEATDLQMRTLASLSVVENQKIEIRTLQNRAQTIEERIRGNKIDIDELNEKKADKQETKSIWQYFLEYTTLKQLSEVQVKIFPVIEQFGEKIKQFEKENDTAKQIIRSFDNVLLEKASKFSIEQIHRKLEKYLLRTEFKDRNDEVDTEFAKHTDLHQGLKDDLKALQDSIGRQIFEAVRRATLTLTKQSTASSNQIATSEEIKALVSSKADKVELERLVNLKSNKVDTESNMRAIDILHSHTSHLIILIMEVVKAVMKVAVETQQARENKKAFILRQAKSVRHWIEKFNPKNVNTYDITVPDEMNAFSKFVSDNIQEVISLAQKPTKIRSDSLSKVESRKEGIKLPPQSKDLLKKEFKFHRKQNSDYEIPPIEFRSPRIRDSPSNNKFSTHTRFTFDHGLEDQIAKQEIRHSWSKSVLVSDSHQIEKQKISRIGLSRRTDLSPRLPSISKM